MSNNFMSMASVSADDHNIHDNNSNNSHGDVNNLLHHDKTLGDGVGGVSIVGMPVVVNPVAAIPVNTTKKRKLPSDDLDGGNQISVCGLHLDQLLCNNTKYTVFDLCELCLDEGVRCRIGKHPNMSSSSGMSMGHNVPDGADGGHVGVGVGVGVGGHMGLGGGGAHMGGSHGFPHTATNNDEASAAAVAAMKHYTAKGKKKNLPSAYRFYFVDQRDLLLQSQPHLTFAEISPLISKSWAKAEEAEKEKYKKMAEHKRNEIIQEAIASQGKKVRMVSAFQFYTKDQRVAIKQINPSVTFAELSTTISKAWATEDEAVKEKYKKMADDTNMAVKNAAVGAGVRC